MPKMINPEVKARAVRLVAEHRQEYPSDTAAAAAVAKQLGLGRESASVSGLGRSPTAERPEGLDVGAARRTLWKRRRCWLQLPLGVVGVGMGALVIAGVPAWVGQAGEGCRSSLRRAWASPRSVETSPLRNRGSGR